MGVLVSQRGVNRDGVRTVFHLRAVKTDDCKVAVAADQGRDLDSGFGANTSPTKEGRHAQPNTQGSPFLKTAQYGQLCIPHISFTDGWG